MLLNLKCRADETRLEQNSASSANFSTQNAPEGPGDQITGRIRLTYSGSARIVKKVPPVSVCPWPATCDCCNKQ